MLRIQRIQSVAHPMTRNKFTFSNSRMLATSANGGVEKTIKTPSMGESITEGTLSQWLKKVGDVVARDEQVASIETDKIDVAVNSPESGLVLELFAKEGDTVAVGGNLLRIALGASPAAQTKSSAPTAAQSISHQQTQKQSSLGNGEHGSRIPLIKFLGASRKSSAVLNAPKPLQHTPNASHKSPVEVETASQVFREVDRIVYQSVDAMPKRFWPKPYSELEMNLINVSLEEMICSVANLYQLIEWRDSSIE